MVKKIKSTSGRQKISIEKIPKKSNLQVTFSKRRSGLFKKASELCTLCGVEIAMIVFSPSNKAFSFGHPEVESIIERYLTHEHHPDLVEAHGNSNVDNLNMQLTQLVNQLEIEKKRGEELHRARKARQRQCWWESPVDELGLIELQQLMFSMKELKKDVTKQANKILMDQTSFSSPNGLFGGFNHAFENKAASGINAASCINLPTGYDNPYGPLSSIWGN